LNIWRNRQGVAETDVAITKFYCIYIYTYTHNKLSGHVTRGLYCRSGSCCVFFSYSLVLRPPNNVGHLAADAYYSVISLFLQLSSRKLLSTSSSHISQGLQIFFQLLDYIIRHYFFKIHFNIIQKSVSRFSMWLLCLRFPNENSACNCDLCCWCYMFGTSISPWFDDTDNINKLSVIKLRIIKFCSASYHFLPPGQKLVLAI
jgi:hypothetical protein